MQKSIFSKLLKPFGVLALLAALLVIQVAPPASAQNYLDRFNGSVLSTFGKSPVDASTTANITLSGYQTIDGVAVINDYMRVLVKNQTDQTTNGIYTVFSSNWVRASDFAGPSGTVAGQLIYVTGGSQAGIWELTTPNPVQIDQSGGQSTAPSNITFAYAPFILTSTTSSTSNTIGTGTKTFVTNSTLPATIGMYVLISETANPTNQMFAQITSYSGGALVVNSLTAMGSGTYTDWTISISGPQGAQGTAGATGPTGPTGPASTPYTQSSISTTTTAASNFYYVATAALTFNVPHSTGLTKNFSVILFAPGGNVAIGVNAGDQLNGGVAGVGATLLQGRVSIITTDASGNIYASDLGTISNGALSAALNNTIKSNISGSTASPADNTFTAILDNIISSTQGTILYRGASVWSALGPGSAGQFLQTGGSAANPSWATPSAGGLVLLGSVNASSSSGAVFGSALLTSAYDHYIIYGNNVNASGVGLQISSNNGSSWLTSSYTSYLNGASVGSGTYVEISNSGSTGSTTNGNIEVHFQAPTVAQFPLFIVRSAFPIAPTFYADGAGYFNTSTSFNAVRVIALAGSGLITGQFNLYGVNGL